MKLYTILAVLVVVFIVSLSEISATPFLSKLFSGYDDSYGYGNSHGGYSSRPRPRSYGRNYGYDQGGGDRYKSICRIHSVDSLGFPGRVGNPVCP